MRKAVKLFEEFHSFEPKDIGSFPKSFRIPREAVYVGEAKTMYYSSDKLNPENGQDEGWISYYHPHEGGVRAYIADPNDSPSTGDIRNLPKWVYKTQELVRLGDCEGFDYTDFSGREIKAEATGRAPEWYCIPSGKALLVIQDKRKVLAVFWGGDLNVEWRGVVG
jgi:hypothetical protein